MKATIAFPTSSAITEEFLVFEFGNGDMSSASNRVVVIGRPNCGKSTIFNYLINRKSSLVSPYPHTTLDYQEGVIEQEGMILVDTMGLVKKNSQESYQKALEAMMVIIAEAKIILYVIELKNGIHPEDSQIIRNLSLDPKRTIAVCHKADKVSELEYHEAFASSKALGFPVITTSIFISEKMQDLRALLKDRLAASNTSSFQYDSQGDIAIVGKPNVGKTSLINLLLGQARGVVSATEHTTRNATESPFKFKKQSFHLIDTPGVSPAAKKSIRAGNQLPARIARQTFNRIKDSNLVIVLIDATEPISKFDYQLLEKIKKAKKSSFVVFTKVDISSAFLINENQLLLKRRFPLVPYVALSNLTRSGLKDLYKIMGQVLYQSSNNTTTTAHLNQVFEKIVVKTRPHQVRGNFPKIKYAHFSDDSHKEIIVHGSKLEYISEQYKRYLISSLAKELKIPVFTISMQFRNQK